MIERSIGDSLGRILQRGFRARLYDGLTAGVAAGLDESTYPALSVIARAVDPVDAGAIAAEIGVDRSVASRRAATLSAAGLIAPVEASDRRRVRFTLTDAGASAVAETRARLDRAVARRTSPWRADDRERFARLLERFSAAPLE